MVMWCVDVEVAVLYCHFQTTFIYRRGLAAKFAVPRAGSRQWRREKHLLSLPVWQFAVWGRKESMCKMLILVSQISALWIQFLKDLCNVSLCFAIFCFVTKAVSETSD